MHWGAAMRDMRSITKMLLGVGIAALVSQAAAARDITIGDIVGRWCGEHSNYTFSRTDMVVTPLGDWTLTHAPHWVIDKVQANGNQIEVFWKPARPGNSTAFELAGNRRTLTQQPQTEGDKGPRRIFHRC
jgi:hypothetical protein